jgi:hypothetical protein
MPLEFIHHQSTGRAGLSPTSRKRMLRKSRQASARTRQRSGVRVVNKLQLPQFLLTPFPTDRAAEVRGPSRETITSASDLDEHYIRKEVVASRSRGSSQQLSPTPLLEHQRRPPWERQIARAGSAFTQAVLRCKLSSNESPNPRILLWLGRLMEVRDHASEKPQAVQFEHLRLAAACVSACLEPCTNPEKRRDGAPRLTEMLYLLAIQNLSARLQHLHVPEWEVWQTVILLALFEVGFIS